MRTDDLHGLKDDMTAFIEGHGMRRFPAYVGDEIASVLWKDAENPDAWKDFVELAKASGAPFLQVSKCNTDPKTWMFSDNPANFTLHNLDCATLADIRETVVRTYYIGCDNGCAGGTLPVLKRADLVGNAIEITALVDGIEDLELEYGFDTNNDGDPDIYRVALSGTAGAADNDWSNVMSARIYLRARTTDAPPGGNDSGKSYLTPAGYIVPTGADTAYKRVNLVSVVRLVNPSGWRELP